MGLCQPGLGTALKLRAVGHLWHPLPCLLLRASTLLWCFPWLCHTSLASLRPPHHPLHPHPLQLEEWESDPSPSQLSLVEAVREVLTALLKDLTRNNR